MPQRPLLVFFGVLVMQCACNLARTAQAADAPARPNILFIFTDDHATHAISAYGSRINQTPNIDRLAREGMLFRNCFVTNSICGPSRAVILTGKHSHLNGFIDNRSSFDGSQQHIGKLLQQAGYQTAMIGKWHLKTDPTGFDRWSVLSAGGGQGTYYNPEFDTDAGHVQYTGYTTDIITDLALDWLEKQRDPQRPFLLMYQHKAPHREWEPGPEHLTMYDDVTLPEPATLFDDYSGRTSACLTQEMTIARHMNQRDLKLVPPPNLTPEQLETWNAAYEPKNEAFRQANLQGDDLVRWKYQRYMKDYLRCVASVDDNIGRVLDWLDRSGLADNTVVIYSSDQGFYLGDHGWFDKRWMYEESLRMPFIVRWPGHTPPGSENDDLVQNLDFAPTFLQMSGTEVPGDMQGASLVPLLEGKEPADWRESIYYHYYEFPAVHMVQRHYGVRTDRYKLIHYYLIDEWELFDLEKDPDELQSVYDDPSYADVRAQLERELERLRRLYQVEEFEEPPAPGDPTKVKLSLRLGFDFERVTGPRVPDGSSLGHHGTLVGGRVVSGRGGHVLELDGNGRIDVRPLPKGLNPGYQPVALGAWCRPQQTSGVIAAMGGPSKGIALYLSEGRPHFAVRSGGTLYEVQAKEPIAADQWTHVAGMLTPQGKLRLAINGSAVGKPAKGSFLDGPPSDALGIGADTGPLVGTYNSANGFHGQLDDVRLYFGPLDEATLAEWSSPGR